DNFIVTVGFDDGTVAALTYVATGARDYPKESMQIFFDGKTIVLDDYKELRLIGGSGDGITTRTADKGQQLELEAFARGIHAGGEWPIALWQQLQSTRVAIEVEKLLQGQAGAQRIPTKSI